MYRHGEISQFTQKDANEWRDNICVCRGVHGEITGEVIFDLDKREFLRQFKIYINSGGYAVTKTNGKTRLIHKILTETEGYDTKTVVDHINGINNDNRIENLRFLCPNCHSLTDSYNGKNKSHFPNVTVTEEQVINALQKTTTAIIKIIFFVG